MELADIQVRIPPPPPPPYHLLDPAQLQQCFSPPSSCLMEAPSLLPCTFPSSRHPITAPATLALVILYWLRFRQRRMKRCAAACMSQGRSYDSPTIIVTDSLGGLEDIPAGVVAVLSLSVTDVLSHVAIRARNQVTSRLRDETSPRAPPSLMASSSGAARRPSLQLPSLIPLPVLSLGFAFPS